MFTHSVVVPNESVTAGTSPSYDLPVSPLSHLLFTIKFQQNLADLQMDFTSIALMISKLEVLYKGSAVCSLNGIDLMAAGLLVCDFESWGVNYQGDNDGLMSFTFLVPFSRQLYSPIEAYPKTSRGELVMQVTWASSFTQIEEVTLQVEAVEMPEANPQRFLKMTSGSVTPTANLEFDVELPIGNQISDIVLFGTTIPAGTTATTTIQEVSIRKNNSEFMYSKSYFETLHNMSGRMRAAPGYWAGHEHRIIVATPAQYHDVSLVKPGNHILSNHLLVPFDVRRDGEHILRTDDANDLNIRIKPGDAEVVRVNPCEVVAISAR